MKDQVLYIKIQFTRMPQFYITFSYIKSNIDGFLFETPSGIAISIHVVAERIII
jgi:hypothetical protein